MIWDKSWVKLRHFAMKTLVSDDMICCICANILEAYAKWTRYENKLSNETVSNWLCEVGRLKMYGIIRNKVLQTHFWLLIFKLCSGSSRCVKMLGKWRILENFIFRSARFNKFQHFVRSQRTFVTPLHLGSPILSDIIHYKIITVKIQIFNKIQTISQSRINLLFNSRSSLNCHTTPPSPKTRI